MQRSETSLYINTKRGQYYPKNKQYGIEWPLLYPFEQAVTTFPLKRPVKLKIKGKVTRLSNQPYKD